MVTGDNPRPASWLNVPVVNRLAMRISGTQVDWGFLVGVIASVSFIGAFRLFGAGKL